MWPLKAKKGGIVPLEERHVCKMDVINVTHSKKGEEHPITYALQFCPICEDWEVATLGGTWDLEDFHPPRLHTGSGFASQGQIWEWLLAGGRVIDKHSGETYRFNTGIGKVVDISKVVSHKSFSKFKDYDIPDKD